VPEDYLERFEKARRTFMHQSVFDPRARKFSSVRPFPSGSALPGEAFLGATYDDDVLCQVADGFVDPVTQRPFVRSEPPPLTSEFVEEGTEDFCPRASSRSGWIHRAPHAAGRPGRHDPGYSLSSAAPQATDRQPPTKKPRQVMSPATVAAGQVAITKFFAKSHKASQQATTEGRPVVIRRPPVRARPTTPVLDDGVQKRAKQMGGFAFTNRREIPRDDDRLQLESPTVVVTPSHPALASLAELAFAASREVTQAASPPNKPVPAARHIERPVERLVERTVSDVLTCCASRERLTDHSDLSRFACTAREEIETEQVAVRA